MGRALVRDSRLRRSPYAIYAQPLEWAPLVDGTAYAVLPKLSNWSRSVLVLNSFLLQSRVVATLSMFHKIPRQLFHAFCFEVPVIVGSKYSSGR